MADLNEPYAPNFGSNPTEEIKLDRSRRSGRSASGEKISSSMVVNRKKNQSMLHKSASTKNVGMKSMVVSKNAMRNSGGALNKSALLAPGNFAFGQSK